MSESWRLLSFDEQNINELFALCDMLLSEVGAGRSPNTMIISNPEVSVMLNRGLNLNTVNLEECKKRGIPVARINHPGAGGPIFFSKGSFGCTYLYVDEGIDSRAKREKVYEVIVKICSNLGLKAKRRVKKNDVLIGDKKISGGKVWKKGNCVYGGFTLLNDFDYDLASAVLKIPKAKFHDKPYKNMRGWITTFNKELGRDVSIDEVRRAIIKAVESVYDVTLIDGEVTDKEKEITAGFMKKITSDSWIRRGKWSSIREYG